MRSHRRPRSGPSVCGRSKRRPRSSVRTATVRLPALACVRDHDVAPGERHRDAVGVAIARRVPCVDGPDAVEAPIRSPDGQAHAPATRPELVALERHPRDRELAARADRHRRARGRVAREASVRCQYPPQAAGGPADRAERQPQAVAQGRTCIGLGDQPLPQQRDALTAEHHGWCRELAVESAMLHEPRRRPSGSRTGRRRCRPARSAGRRCATRSSPAPLVPKPIVARDTTSACGPSERGADQGGAASAGRPGGEEGRQARRDEEPRAHACDPLTPRPRRQDSGEEGLERREIGVELLLEVGLDDRDQHPALQPAARRLDRLRQAGAGAVGRERVGADDVDAADLRARLGAGGRVVGGDLELGVDVLAGDVELLAEARAGAERAVVEPLVAR